MKLKKAIRVMKDEERFSLITPNSDLRIAHLLAIEALKREGERREYKVFRIPTLLPGETEE